MLPFIKRILFRSKSVKKNGGGYSLKKHITTRLKEWNWETVEVICHLLKFQVHVLSKHKYVKGR